MKNERYELGNSGADKPADNFAEMLAVLDENGNPAGKFLDRKTIHEKHLFHNEVSLWVLNPKTREVLLQRRSPHKILKPNKLGLCAGHVVGNQTIEETLREEVRQEIGLDISQYKVKPLLRSKRQEPGNHFFSSSFYILEEIPLEKFTIQKCELSELVYMNYKTLEGKIRNNDPEFTMIWGPHYEQVFKKLDEIFAAV